MINLFQNYDRNAADLLRSQLFAKINVPSVAIYDDGYLPDNIESPVKFFCKQDKTRKPLYFDKVKFPKYWRIKSTADLGEVFDLHRKRAEIIYGDTDNSRSVKEVHWFGDNGNISWIDHYDKHGNYFAKTYLVQGVQTIRNYFDNHGKKIITWNMLNGFLSLRYKNQLKSFTNLADFIVFYLKERHFNLHHIFYNSLDVPFMVSTTLDVDGEDTLFWQEATGEELPGNMQALMSNRTRTKHIAFQRYLDWQKWQEQLENQQANVDFQYLGIIYPHPRGNNMKPSAVVFTNSDQIEQLDQLAIAMKNVHITVAAVTEMSAKLLAMRKYSNVELIPAISNKRSQELMKQADIYLDINHGNEILDSVRAAFENNMLILGFEDTVHEPLYVDSENIFKKDDSVSMVRQILGALVQPSRMKQLIDHQRLVAGDVTIDDYKKTFGVLTGERR